MFNFFASKEKEETNEMAQKADHEDNNDETSGLLGDQKKKLN